MKKLLLSALAFCACAPLAAGIHSPKNMTEYEAIIQEPGKLYMVDFYADYCGPCKMLKKALPGLHDKFEGLEIVKVDTQNSNFSSLTKKHVKQGIPMVVFIKDGDVVDTMVGFGGSTVPFEHKISHHLKKKMEAAPVPKKMMQKAAPKKEMAMPKMEEKKEVKQEKKKYKKSRKSKDTKKKAEKKAQKKVKKERKKEGKKRTKKSCKSCKPCKTSSCGCSRC